MAWLGADSSQMALTETAHLLKVASLPSVGLAWAYSWQLDVFQENDQKHARHVKAWAQNWHLFIATVIRPAEIPGVKE